MANISLQPLAEHPEHFDTVVEWLRGEWAMEPGETFEWLQPGCERPGALLAMSGARPVGVLGFRRHQSRFQHSPEL